jgi:hypothetical protein
MIVFTTAYVPLGGHVNMTTECIESFQEQFDKCIVVQNGTGESLGHIGKPHTYIVNHVNRYHAGAINQCADLCNDDDFIVFANNDTFNIDCDLKTLCQAGELTSPHFGQDACKGAHASFFVIQKKDFIKVGYWKLSEGHEADEEWFARARAIMPSVTVRGQEVGHNTARTVKAIQGSDRDPRINKELREYLLNETK